MPAKPRADYPFRVKLAEAYRLAIRLSPASRQAALFAEASNVLRPGVSRTLSETSATERLTVYGAQLELDAACPQFLTTEDQLLLDRQLCDEYSQTVDQIAAVAFDDDSKVDERKEHTRSLERILRKRATELGLNWHELHK